MPTPAPSLRLPTGTAIAPSAASCICPGDIAVSAVAAGAGGGVDCAHAAPEINDEQTTVHSHRAFILQSPREGVVPERSRALPPVSSRPSQTLTADGGRQETGGNGVAVLITRIVALAAIPVD